MKFLKYVFLFITLTVSAQGNSGNGNGNGPGNNNGGNGVGPGGGGAPGQIPIDGGTLAFIISTAVAGAGYLTLRKKK